MDTPFAAVRLPKAPISRVDDGGFQAHALILILTPAQPAHDQVAAACYIGEVNEGFQKLVGVCGVNGPGSGEVQIVQSGPRAKVTAAAPTFLVHELRELTSFLDQLLQEDPLTGGGLALVVDEDLVEDGHVVDRGQQQGHELQASALILAPPQEVRGPLSRFPRLNDFLQAAIFGSRMVDKNLER